jgi:hypothetical protein
MVGIFPTEMREPIIWVLFPYKRQDDVEDGEEKLRML